MRPLPRRLLAPALAVALALALSACAEPAPAPPEPDVSAGRAQPPAADATPATPPPTATATPTPETSPPAASPRPAWLGTRPLEPGPHGYAAAQPTPPELVDRRLVTPEVLPPPADGQFAATVAAVPDDVIARSTWAPGCPVDRADLRYLTVSFWGFDEQPHTGELIVHADVAEDLVTVFRRLFDARFPLEELRVTTVDERDAAPTGDGNNSGAFVCRPSRGTTRWSAHARGLAVDLNPFHNPYVKGEVVLPELATAYADRNHQRPGMIQPGDVVTEAFAAIGWQWGGDWRSLKDWMHFSADGS